MFPAPHFPAWPFSFFVSDSVWLQDITSISSSLCLCVPFLEMPFVSARGKYSVPSTSCPCCVCVSAGAGGGPALLCCCTAP